MSMHDRIEAFVTDLLRDRRPRRFKASAEELEAAQAAAEMATVRPAADLPDEAFIDRLSARLRSQMEAAPASGVSRRTLLRTAGFAAAAGVAGAVVDRAIVTSSTSGQEALVPTRGTWRAVAAVSDIPDRSALAFTSGAVQGFVVNHNGSIKAVSAVCTHQGCILQLELAKRLLACPCHATEFGLDGKLVSHQLAAPPRDLPTLQTRIRDGLVEVLAV